MQPEVLPGWAEAGGWAAHPPAPLSWELEGTSCVLTFDLVQAECRVLNRGERRGVSSSSRCPSPPWACSLPDTSPVIFLFFPGDLGFTRRMSFPPQSLTFPSSLESPVQAQEPSERAHFPEASSHCPPAQLSGSRGLQGFVLVQVSLLYPPVLSGSPEPLKGSLVASCIHLYDLHAHCGAAHSAEAKLAYAGGIEAHVSAVPSVLQTAWAAGSVLAATEPDSGSRPQAHTHN